MVNRSFFGPAGRHHFPRKDCSTRRARGELSFSRVAKSNTSSFAKRLANLNSCTAVFERACHLPLIGEDKYPKSCNRDWTCRTSSSVNGTAGSTSAGFIVSGSGPCEEESALANFPVVLCSSAVKRSLLRSLFQ